MTYAQVLQSVYRFLSPALAATMPLPALFSSKLRRGVAGRRGIEVRIADSASALQGCIWFHTSSVGEYEQARPVVDALREAGHGPLVVTHFSPSGYDYAQANPSGDHHDYLPWDTPRNMANLVRAWRPRCLVCVKYDGWPHQVAAARNAGVPVVMISGALPARAGRLHPLVRPFFRDLYGRFSAIGVGAKADSKRFAALLGSGAKVMITGDTRAEQVIRRYEAAAGGEIAAALADWGKQRLILGSTWPPDEDIWIPACRPLMEDHPGLRIVLVPHEPTPDRLRALERRLERHDIPHQRWSSFAERRDGACRCVLVDRVGILADIYYSGTIAHVGGGYTTGVHSTLEPAVASLPVSFGPRIGNAEEALLMVRREGGWVLYESAGALMIARRLLGDEVARARAGEIAHGIVMAQMGATERSVELILEEIAASGRATDR